MMMKDDIDDNRLSDLCYMMMIDNDGDFNKCWPLIRYDNIDDRWRW